MTMRKRTVIAVILSILCVFCFMPGIPQQAQAKSVKPGKVSGIKVKRSGTRTKITWKKGRNAKKYKLTYQTGKGQNKTTHFRTTKHRYCTVKSSKKVGYVAIKSVNGKKKSAYKKWGKEDKTPEAYEYDMSKMELDDNADGYISAFSMRYAKKYEIKVQINYSGPTKKVLKYVSKKPAVHVNLDNELQYFKVWMRGVRGNKKSITLTCEPTVDYPIKAVAKRMHYWNTCSSKKHAMTNIIDTLWNSSDSDEYNRKYRSYSDEVPDICIIAKNEGVNLNEWCYSVAKVLVKEDSELLLPDQIDSLWDLLHTELNYSPGEASYAVDQLARHELNQPSGILYYDHNIDAEGHRVWRIYGYDSDTWQLPNGIGSGGL